MPVIREKETAHIVDCLETYEGAELLAKRAAKRTGKTVYVDMCSGLPNTPWIVWTDTKGDNTRYLMYLTDLDSHRDQRFEPL